jgi:COP9 signalosome complex subunit 1
MASSLESARATPKLDLESYISNYDGPLRLERLITIASSKSHLSTEAHRLAVIQAKKGLNVDLYLSLASAFQKVAPNDPVAAVDMEWTTMTTKRVKSETDRLEHELKAYKNNLIKESIRVGYPVLMALMQSLLTG